MEGPTSPAVGGDTSAAQVAEGGYVFTAPPSPQYSLVGYWINAKHLNDDFVKIVRKLGMPGGRDGGFTIQSLRHFFKTFCITHGVPREYVDAWQGHKSIRTASAHYVHTIDAESLRLMELVPFGDGMTAANAV